MHTHTQTNTIKSLSTVVFDLAEYRYLPLMLYLRI